MLQKIKGMIRLFRPELPLAAGICVVTGQVLSAGQFPSIQTVILGFLSVFALSGSALIFNDYFDYEVDLVNAPERPLPSGAVTPREVIVLAVLTTLMGFAAAAWIGIGVFLLSIPVWVVGFLYNWRYKQSGLPGNLMVASSVGLTFIFGALTVGAPWNPVVWTFAAIAFLIDLGEEIAGDAMDMEGDKKRGSKSLAIRKGRQFAVGMTIALWGGVVLISFLPVLMGWLGAGYLVFISIMDIVLFYFSIRLWKSKTPQEGRKAMRGAYLGASLGVLAFLLGLFIV